jgi:dCMP deaminase
MEVARTVRTRANCWGALVGAVLVRDNRIVSTGFNGAPSNFANCRDGGCERCRQRELHSRGEFEHVADPEVASGPKQLDLCVCVHAEANALLSSAKFGNRTEGSTLYTTSKPCFACLKEAYQGGVARIVYLEDWEPTDSQVLRAQYDELAEHLASGNPRNFEQLARQRDVIASGHGEPREPDLDDRIDPSHGTSPVIAVAQPPAQKRQATAKKAKRR